VYDLNNSMEKILCWNLILDSSKDYPLVNRILLVDFSLVLSQSKKRGTELSEVLVERFLKTSTPHGISST
jgi:hypothetical protein